MLALVRHIFIVVIASRIFDLANGFCFHTPGGVGEYHQECMKTDGVGKES